MWLIQLAIYNFATATFQCAMCNSEGRNISCTLDYCSWPKA